ncbi:hypothetical protein ACVHAO_004818, partial [Salmonella enterica subsp. enterica serovar Infantis]
ADDTPGEFPGSVHYNAAQVYANAPAMQDSGHEGLPVLLLSPRDADDAEQDHACSSSSSKSSRTET